MTYLLQNQLVILRVPLYISSCFYLSYFSGHFLLLILLLLFVLLLLFFFFNFCQFNSKGLCLGLFGLILFGILCVFWAFLFSYPGLENFWLLFLCMFSLPLSLFLYWKPYKAVVCTFDVASDDSNCPPFLIPVLFFVVVQLEWFLFICLPVTDLFFIMFNLILNTSCVYLFQLLFSSALFASSLYFLTLLIFLLCSSILILSLLSIFMIITLNSILV